MLTDSLYVKLQGHPVVGKLYNIVPPISSLGIRHGMG